VLVPEYLREVGGMISCRAPSCPMLISHSRPCPSGCQAHYSITFKRRYRKPAGVMVLRTLNQESDGTGASKKHNTRTRTGFIIFHPPSVQLETVDPSQSWVMGQVHATPHWDRG